MKKEKTEDNKKHFEGKQLTDDELANVTAAGGFYDRNYVPYCKGIMNKRDCNASAEKNSSGVHYCAWKKKNNDEYCDTTL